jgi:adhesin/invasin
MSNRRRLSVERLEDRTNPASLNEQALATYFTTLTLKDMMEHIDHYSWLANPAAGPLVKSFFNNVYQQSQTTLSMFHSSSGLGAALVKPLAQLNASFAKGVGSLLGFNLSAPSGSTTTTPPPTTSADAGMTNTMPSATSPSWVAQASGLKIWDVKQGTGEAVTAGATINVFYTGWLAADGTKFDSVRSPASPANFNLNNLIQGWQQGIVGMKDGGIRRLYVPAALGYGAAGSPPKVPGNADLIFEIKLISHTNVTTGTPSLSQSSVAVAQPSVAVGGTTLVTLTARNAAGTPLSTGGSTVAFSLGSVSGGQGTFGAVSDNGNGTYTATFTGSTAGINTITATIGGQALTSTAPAITVTAPPGPADLAQTIVAASPASVAVGGTSTVTLTAKDTNGTPLTTGGATVVFSLGNPASGGQGTFGSVTDNGNGTYTAIFTGTTAGTNTITATYNSQAVTSTAPTITVTAGPGPVDLAQTTVAPNPASVAVGGTSTVTLTARDTSGTPLTTGGATVLFGLGNPSSGGQGTFSTVTDNGNGTYTATLTGTTAGTNTITATYNGQAVTSTAPTVTVTAATGGTASPAQSTVAASPASVAVGATSTITLTAKDASGNALTTGGSTVLFGLGSNTGGEGTFGTVADNGNGTYTATFTGTTVGTNTITATIGGQAVTTTAPSIAVTTATTATDLTQSTVAVESDTIQAGEQTSVTLTATDANGDPVTDGGATVVFHLGNGSAGGTFGAVTDNADGTYTATFTGGAAGTNTITATVNGQAITTTAAPITVTPAPVADPAQSFVSLAPDTIAIGEAADVTLTAVDTNGDPLTAGGATVVFKQGTGAGRGTFSSVTDNGDGTYTATYTGTVAGDNTLSATLNGTALSSDPATITVT